MALWSILAIAATVGSNVAILFGSPAAGGVLCGVSVMLTIYLGVPR